MGSEGTPTSRVIFDMETDGLLEEGRKVHCICTEDLSSDSDTSSLRFSDHLYLSKVVGSIADGVDYLNSFDLVIGHNIIGFDIPYLLKLGYVITAEPRDTFVMSKMFFPEQKQHGLEYYGKKFGRYKPEIDDWSECDDDKLHRCVEDVAINRLTYEYFVVKELSKWNWMPSILLEQRFYYEQVLQEYEGVDIDVELALSLIEELDERVDSIDKELRPRLPKKIKSKGPVNKPFLQNGDYSKMTKDWYYD